MWRTDESIFGKRDLGYGVGQRIIYHTGKTPASDDWCRWDRREKAEVGGKGLTCKVEDKGKDEKGKDDEEVL